MKKAARQSQTAKKQQAMQKNENPNRKMKHGKILFSTLAVCTALLLTSIALWQLRSFTGYQVLSEAGSITSLVLIHKQASVHWQGYYGLALMDTQFNDTQTDSAQPGEIKEKHLIFSCLQPNIEHEVYAATSDPRSMDWSSVTAGTIQMVDDYLNISSNSTDSANNTFTFTDYYIVSGTNISSVPTAYTYVNGSSTNTTFPIGILNISGNLVFVAKAASTITKNYKGGSSNYQMLVAVPNSTVTYYFATDKGDTCGTGLTSGVIGTGNIIGYATTESGAPILNVNISVSSANNLTDSSGFFNVTVPVGYHQFVGTKSGYQAHIGTANVSLLNTTWHNFTLSEFRGFNEGNGTVAGQARDNATNATIAGVMVHVAGRTTTTDSTGNYSINATIGNQILVALKAQYSNYVLLNVTINFTNTTLQDIYLAPLFGTIQGKVFRTDTSASLENATISAAGQTATSNSSGLYLLQVLSGSHTITATKSGYDVDADAMNVTAGGTTFVNFSLTPVTGTLAGTVYDNVTNTTLSAAKVYMANMLVTTNSSGNFSITVAAGTQVLWVFREGYETLAQNLTITGLETTTTTIRLRPTNGTLTGNVTDSSTSQRLSNVTISINGVSATTDNGSYNLTTVTGNHVFVAVKAGYESFAGNVTLEPGNVTYRNIQLIVSNVSTGTLTTGYVTGKVTTSTGAILENVSVSIAGNTNATNSTGHYFLNASQGIHNIVATRSGYIPHAAAITINGSNTTLYNINMSAATIAGFGAGLGAGAGAGKGSGTGAASTKTTQASQVVKEGEGVKSVLDVSRIIRILRQGTFATVPISITNYKSTPILLSLQITGDVAPMVLIDKTAVVLVPSEKTDATLKLLALGKQGAYNGSLVVSGDVYESVPIDIIITEKDRLSIETLQIRMQIFEKNLNPGGQLRYKVDIQNLLSDEGYPVSLSYEARHQSRNITYDLGNDELKLIKSQSLLKDYRLPKDAPAGDYILEANADYAGFESSYKEPFTVSLPLYKYSFLGFLPLWAIALGLLAISTGALGAAGYQKRKAKNKRYQIQVDYKSIPKAGPRSALVGRVAETQNNAYLDLDLFQIHTLIAGASGSGKTVTASILVEEALLHGASVMVFDPTAQWTGFLRKNADKKMLASYPQFGMKQADAKSFSGNIREILDKNELIEIKKFMKPGEITVFVINKIEPQDINVVISNVIKNVFKANLSESKELRLLLVFDEVHRLLPKFGGTGQGFLQIERATREFRKWGVGLILISQVLTDFIGEIKANINTEIQMRTRDETDMKRIQEMYGPQALKSVVKAAVGTGMIENSNYNRGKPFFSSFRPPLHNHAALADEELDNYNKYNIIIDDIEYQLDQLKAEGVDIFDIQLELKLAKDKLKLGNFNMVDIYMEGLKPKVEGQWKKLGKQPKHYEMKINTETDEEKAKEAKKEDTGKDSTNSASQAQAPAQGPVPGPEVPPKAQQQSTIQAQDSPTAKNQIAAAKSLIESINSSISQGNAQDAKNIYSQLSGLYKSMSKEEKAKIYDDIASLSGKIPK